MTTDDVAQEMRFAIVDSIRRYAWDYGGLPPGAFLTTVLQRRVMIMNRNARVWFRALDDSARAATEDDERYVIPDNVLARPDEEITHEEMEEVYRALVYALRRDLPPAAFAILHLRVIEELTPEQIASMTGIESNTLASKRIGYAKRVAWEFLKELGIHTLEDADASTLEDLHGC